MAATAALIPAIAREFSLSPFIVGKIIWLYMLPYGLAALFYGPLVRIFDAKKIELVCFLLFSLANLASGLCANIKTLFLARFFMGLFGASVVPLVLILIAAYNDKKTRGKLVGIFFSATFLSSLLGLFLSGIINWRLIYLIPALCGFVLLGAMYLFLPSFRPAQLGIKENYLGAFKNKNVISIFTYILFISMFYHGVQQWLGVYFANKFSFGQFVISMLVTLTSLSGILGEVLGGWFSDSLGRVKTVNLGILLMIISVFSLLFKLPVYLLGVIMVVWGLGWTFNHAGLSTMLTDLPKEFLNEAASLNSSVRFLAGGIGVVVGGVLTRINFNLRFLIFGISLVLLLLFNKKMVVTLEEVTNE